MKLVMYKEKHRHKQKESEIILDKTNLSMSTKRQRSAFLDRPLDVRFVGILCLQFWRTSLSFFGLMRDNRGLD